MASITDATVTYEDVTQSLVKLYDTPDSMVCYVDTVANDVQTRTEVTFTVKRPRANAGSPGGFTQQRYVISGKRPYIAADGSRSFSTFSITTGVDIRESALNVTYFLTLLSSLAEMAKVGGTLDSFAIDQSVD